MIEDLMNISEADIDVLRKNNELGDNFSIPRDVDFYFVAEDHKKADIVCGFINDYNYASAEIEERNDGTFGVKAIINMPINQPIIQSVSGFMAVIANMFGADYVGWGSIIQTENKID